jgi:hypothetical protein
MLFLSRFMMFGNQIMVSAVISGDSGVAIINWLTAMATAMATVGLLGYAFGSVYRWYKIQKTRWISRSLASDALRLKRKDHVPSDFISVPRLYICSYLKF